MENLKDSFYKELIEKISDGIYFVDKDRKILYWNKSSERITGFPREEVLGRHCFDNILRHINDEGKELCKEDCPLVHSIKNKRVETAEVYLHRKDSVRVPVSVSASPIYNDEGEPVGTVEIFRENTELIATRGRLKELEEKAF